MNNAELRYEINQLALEWARRPNSAWSRCVEAAARWSADLARQGLANNLWDNHPGEIDRWADDGGPARE